MDASWNPRKSDAFGTVKKAIDEMKAHLKKQQAAEATKKAWAMSGEKRAY